MPAFWEAIAVIDRVTHFGQYVGDVEAQSPGHPHHLARGVDGHYMSYPEKLKVFDRTKHIVEHHQVPAAGQLADQRCGI
jgi:hypothetical protein